MTQDSDSDTGGSMDGIRYNPDGTITLTIDEVNRVLRVPKFGEFKKLKKAILELQQQVLESAGISPDEATTTDPNEMIALIRKHVPVDKEDEWSDRVVEMTAEVMRLVVSTLGKLPLPEDIDEWPTWLIVSDTNLARMVAHWRTVPLGRG